MYYIYSHIGYISNPIILAGKPMFLSNILSYRFSLEFEMSLILSVTFSLSQASVSPCSVKWWNIELRLSLGERFMLLKFVSVIISKEILLSGTTWNKGNPGDFHEKSFTATTNSAGEEHLARRFDRRWWGSVAVRTSRFFFTCDKMVIRGLRFFWSLS